MLDVAISFSPTPDSIAYFGADVMDEIFVPGRRSYKSPSAEGEFVLYCAAWENQLPSVKKS